MEHWHIFMTLVIFGRCLIVCQAANYGEACTVSADCTHVDQDCVNSVCGCNSDRYRNTATASCELKVGLGVGCSVNEACSTANAECNGSPGTCQCSSGYQAESSSCKADLGGSCSEQSDCAYTNTVCNGQVCSCDTSIYYDDNGVTPGGACAAKVGLGQGCSVNEACSTANAECSASGTCQCSSGYQEEFSSCKADLGTSCYEQSDCAYTNTVCSGQVCSCDTTNYYDDNGVTPGGACAAKVGLGSGCSVNEACSTTNAECSGSGTCQCSSGYQEESSSCKADLGTSCVVQSDCAYTNTVCSGQVCSCDTSNYYDDNGVTPGGACAAKVGLGVGCSVDEACSTANAECSASGSCQCSSGYQAESSSCKADLGTICAVQSDCADTNTVCSAQVCICDASNYYDDNEASPGGACAAKVGLDSQCPRDAACSTANAVCSGGSCKCNTGYQQFSTECKADLGTSCAIQSDCADTNTVCSAQVCICDATYYYDDNEATPGGACAAKVGLGSLCPRDAACSTANAVCSGDSCKCKTGYQQVSTECKADLGTSCAVQSDCADANTVCSSQDLVCSCDTNYYDDNEASQGGACAAKVGLGSQCPRDAACSTANSDCSGGSCKCNTGYQQVSTECKADLGTTCSVSSDCADSNTVCNNAGECACNTNYYDDNGATILGGDCQLKKDIGVSCIASDECEDDFSTCTGGVCACQSGYYDTGPGSPRNCLKRDLGEACTNSNQCEDTNTVCDTTCKCAFTHYDDNTDGQVGGQCIKKKDLGYACIDVRECEDNNTECSNNRCTCKSDYYDTQQGSVGGECQKSEINEGCTDVSQCRATNTICSGAGICSCHSDYYRDGSTCRLKKRLEEVCGSTDQCADNNAECSSKCQCRSGYYNTGTGSDGTCVQQVSLGSSCGKNEACITNNAMCQSERCVCQGGFYDDNAGNTGGNCQPRKNLFAQCSSPTYVADQCSDPNAMCVFYTSSYTCQCIVGYVPDNNRCIPNKANGENCVGARCSDPNADCLNDVCTCNTNHYDDNGQASGGNCESVDKLKVTNVRFDSVETSSFTVRWDAPAESAHVNNYQVIWRVKGNTVGTGSSSPQSLATSYLISSLDAGQAYTVTVTSINSVTRIGYSRTTSVSKEQATKPNMPGSLTISSLNLDARSGSIILYWSRPEGSFSGYTVKLLDNNVVKATQDVTSSYVTIGFNAIKNGYRYTVEITAKSMVYEVTQVELGASRRETIQTTVQVPDPPENVACEQTGVQYIQLSWAAPSVPNGEMKNYYVKTFIYFAQGSQTFLNEKKTNAATFRYNVTDLEPGTFYQFRLYAENEMYNSTQFGQPISFCGTTAEVSSIPRNLSVTEKSSRHISITWTDPENVNSAELLGYVVRFKVAADQTCIKEHIYRCSDCVGAFPAIQSCLSPETASKSKAELEGQQTYRALGLMPDVEYEITVSAINSLGQGRIAELTETTLEEAPGKPFGVTISELASKSIRVSWEMNGDRPGKTTYTVVLRAATPAIDKTHTVQGFGTTTALVQGLEEFWNYTITVQAATSIGQSTSDAEVPFRTLATAPGKVSNFNIQTSPGDDYNKLRITWQPPTILEQNGILKEYVFRSNTSENLQRNSEANGNSFTETLDVEIERTYFVEVFAVNTGNEVGEKEYRTVITPAGVPVNTLGPNVAIVMPQVVSEQTALTIKIDERFLELSSRGTVRSTGVICCAQAKCNANSVSSLTLDNFNNLPTWHQASKEGYPMYRATSDNWLAEMSSRRKRALNEKNFKIGADSCTGQNENEFCNGPLSADTAYFISVVVCTTGGCLVSDWYGPYRTEKVPEDGPNIGGIAGGITGAVVAIIVVVIVIVVIRRRRKNPSTKYIGDSEMSIDEKPQVNIKKKRPHRLSDWENYLNEMHKDANLLFAAEYEDLKAISPAHPQTASNKEENRLKNRYINILPFDHSIVKLSSNGEDDGQDYINANYLPGYKSRREYIGCQGPIPATIDDFWRMVWEQNVSVIVMLTLCKEGQKVKCEQYWPDEVNEPKQYGEIIVESTSKSTIKTYDYRIFNLTVGNKTSTVKHFHFLNWLDFSANVQTGIMIDFLAQVRAHVQPPDTAGPIIVHCSAGVGRTGTYVALDHLMQFINDHDDTEEIDIFDMVLQLRENRPHMVQTEQQYIFIHDCVKEIMERKNQHIYQNFGFSNQDEDIYQNEPDLYENVSTKPEQRTNL